MFLNLINQVTGETYLFGCRTGQAIPCCDFIIEVGQRFWDIALVIDSEAEPQAEHGDVDSEFVLVHAVEVLLNDVKFALIGCFGESIVTAFEECLSQAEQFTHHTE